ncbi:hypothetical protein N665_0073s0131 [Sinapis alba]|nr:hypothetical protein N665_0073s0131 [Sinapis alba]
MGSSKLKRAIGAVKDQTSVGLAKVNGRSASLSELDVAIVKATRHEEYPAEEKYIREILSLTSYSRHYINACVNTLSRRLNKTKCWTVALKTLILIQRLLAEGDKAYEQEIFFATRRGTRLLNMSDFRDVSRSNSWDYSAFVRTYALYLDERLDFRMQMRHGKRGVYCVGGGDTVEDEKDKPEADLSTAIVVRSQPIAEMKTEQIFTRVQHLQQLLERFLACRPTGGARNNRVVIVALYPIVKESFQIYYDVTEIMGILIERFMELDIPDSIKVYDIFCRVSKQFEELDQFYSWCKNMGIARSSEYPEIEKITQKKLDLMDEFIKDKSSLETKTSQSVKSDEDDDEAREEEVNEEQEDMNAIKALPAPPPKEEEEEEQPEEEVIIEKKQEEVGDLLDLVDINGGEAAEAGDSLALALFDGPYASGSCSESGPGWETFNDDGADWETALVQTATKLSGQKTELGGGFDMLLLNGMYQHGTVNAAVQTSTAYGASGSASSMAFGSAGRPAATMLALPAPVTANGNSNGTVAMDPFAASLEVAPPPYVQMNDMEKKQRMLMEEQMMWDQYSREGRQGHMNLRQNQNQPSYSYTPQY